MASDLQVGIHFFVGEIADCVNGFPYIKVDQPTLCPLLGLLSASFIRIVAVVMYSCEHPMTRYSAYMAPWLQRRVSFSDASMKMINSIGERT